MHEVIGCVKQKNLFCVSASKNNVCHNFLNDVINCEKSKYPGGLFMKTDMTKGLLSIMMKIHGILQNSVMLTKSINQSLKNLDIMGEKLQALSTGTEIIQI